MFTDESMKGGRKAVRAATARTAFFEMSGDWISERTMGHHPLFPELENNSIPYRMHVPRFFIFLKRKNGRPGK
jgi:hypothetical protein